MCVCIPVYVPVCLSVCVCATGSATQAGRIFYIRQRQAAAAATATRGCQRKEKASSSSRSRQRSRAKGESRREEGEEEEERRGEQGSRRTRAAIVNSSCHVTFAYTLLLLACLHDFDPLPPLPACLCRPACALLPACAPLPLPAFVLANRICQAGRAGNAHKNMALGRAGVAPPPAFPPPPCRPVGLLSWQQDMLCSVCPAVLLCPVAHCDQLQ